VNLSFIPVFKPHTHKLYLKTLHQGLLWQLKSRSQKNRQVPFSGASFESQEPVKFLKGANFFEPKQWMIACTWHVQFHV
jgi:hypothetical protein